MGRIRVVFGWWLLVCLAGGTVHAAQVCASGMIEQGLSAPQVVQVVGTGWDVGNYSCSRTLNILQICTPKSACTGPSSTPADYFRVDLDVIPINTTTSHPYELCVEFTGFWNVDLTIDSTTKDISVPGVYLFPEIEVATFTFNTGIPTLGEWGAIAAAVGLLGIGVWFIARRGNG